MSLKTLTSRIKSERVKSFVLFEKEAFQYGARILRSDLSAKKALNIPNDIEQFLLELGEGYINNLHIHGNKEISSFDKEIGQFEGLVAFASDSLGNYFADSPNIENPNKIFYCIYDEHELVAISNNS